MAEEESLKALPLTLSFRATLPNYQEYAFDDTASAKDALEAVLKSKGKNDDENKIYDTLVKFAGPTVGDLRQLTDSIWSKIPIPALCRVYLKHLVRESARTNSMALSGGGAIGASERFLLHLQADFNYGQPFELTPYAEHLQTLLEKGYKRDEALEALLLTGNQGVQPATQVLYTDAHAREKLRKKVVDKLGRKGPMPGDGQSSALFSRLSMLHQQTDREKADAAKLVDDKQSLLKDKAQTSYKAYVQGLMGDEQINEVELERLEEKKNELKISASDHIKILQDLGFTAERFQAAKVAVEDAGKGNCVTCGVQPADVVCFPCTHLPFCQEDADKMMAGDKTCPICKTGVESIEKIFIS